LAWCAIWLASCTKKHYSGEKQMQMLNWRDNEKQPTQDWKLKRREMDEWMARSSMNLLLAY
jgi:hypothetical protein